MLTLLHRMIFDPKVFNYVILVLYMLNAGRWAIERSWGNFFYWVSAFGITASVTWGLNK